MTIGQMTKLYAINWNLREISYAEIINKLESLENSVMQMAHAQQRFAKLEKKNRMICMTVGIPRSADTALEVYWRVYRCHHHPAHHSPLLPRRMAG